MTVPADYLANLEAWRTERLRKLKGPEGWLNIIGRWNLAPGATTMGSDPGNDIVLGVGPAHVGTVTQAEDGSVTFTQADGGATTLLKLDKKAPPRFVVDRLLFEVTSLNGENAVRVRDTRSPAPDALTSIESFPVDPAWRIEAKWLLLDAPLGLTVGTTRDILTDVEVTHKAVFAHGGRTVELIATHGTPEAPQFVLRDLTSRDSTYPASRFVYGEDVTDNSIVLDFNKAINPPCAFTEHAICPLPPAQNILPFRIEAGEKRLSQFWT